MMMYPTRIVPMVIPVAAGVSAFGGWAVMVVSALGLLLVALLAARAIRLHNPATRDDQLTGGHLEGHRS
jgi:hypothetical protein